MSRICCSVTVELLSEAVLYSGYSVPGGETLALRLDDKGSPLIPASTVKGLLRQSVEDLLCWTGGSRETLDALFGRAGLRHENPRRHLIFGDLKPNIPLQEESEWSSSRVFVKTGDEEQVSRKLRSAACLRKGLIFTGLLLCDEEDLPLLEEGFRGIRWMGLMRNRGFGWVKARIDADCPLRQMPQPGQTKVLRYRLRLLTPMTVSWVSQSGVESSGNRDFTQSRDYLPGAAMRGMVLSALALRDQAWFAEHKEELLKKIRFLNAFPMAEEGPQIPTPAGFYADKAQTRFYSVLSREVEPGDKRARLGGYCRLEEGTIRDHAPTMTTLRRITNRQYSEFSCRAISADTVLEGYILLEDETLADRVASGFTEYVSMGADRYAGLGLCRVECLDTGLPDFLRYSYSADDIIPAKLYMMLLAPTTMTRFGEPVGIDEEQLAKALGVETVTVERCATGFTQSAGFNRNLGGTMDTVTMYEKGSIFCLSCDRAPNAEALRRLELEGIGIRRQEGYGQVLFLRDFENIRCHDSGNDRAFQQSDSSRFRQKRLEWLHQHAARFPSGLTKSHKRTLQSLLTGILYGTRTQKDLDILLEERANKESAPKIRDVYQKLYVQMDAILNTPLAVTLQCPGCPDPEDKRERYRLFLDWLELSKRGGYE